MKGIWARRIMCGDAPLPLVIENPCQHRDCKVPAMVVPKLHVPPRGFEGFEPFAVLCQIEVCWAHYHGLVARDLRNRAVDAACTEVMKRAGVEPDFDKAYLMPVHLASGEYRAFLREVRRV